jgi:phosphoglycolate phosphatase-like HAD superfamily hydrolase
VTLVLFDLDGTLVDSGPGIRCAGAVRVVDAPGEVPTPSPSSPPG